MASGELPAELSDVSFSLQLMCLPSTVTAHAFFSSARHKAARSGATWPLLTSAASGPASGASELIGTDGLGHNELASCVSSRRSMPINKMTPVNA